MVVEKGEPSLPFVGIGPVPGHGARHRALGELKAKLLNLPVDARHSSCWILGSHPVNGGTDVGSCARSSSVAPRCPAPGPLEALAMPADDGLGLDGVEHFLPARPPAAQGEREESIGCAETRSRLRPSEDGKLLSEREVFRDQVGPAGEDREQIPGDEKGAVEHPRTMLAVRAEGNRAYLRAIRVSCRGTQLVEGQGGRGCGEGQPLSDSERLRLPRTRRVRTASRAPAPIPGRPGRTALECTRL